MQEWKHTGLDGDSSALLKPPGRDGCTMPQAGSTASCSDVLQCHARHFQQTLIPHRVVQSLIPVLPGLFPKENLTCMHVYKHMKLETRDPLSHSAQPPLFLATVGKSLSEMKLRGQRSNVHSHPLPIYFNTATTYEQAMFLHLPCAIQPFCYSDCPGRAPLSLFWF